jgi:hypothetical protein
MHDKLMHYCAAKRVGRHEISPPENYGLQVNFGGDLVSDGQLEHIFPQISKM